MFENEIAINEFQIGHFRKVVVDLPESSLFVPGVGHGHPPAWILGHLAFVAEFGQAMLGGSLKHPAWMPLFGPGSSGVVAPEGVPNRDGFAEIIIAEYQTLRAMARTANPRAMAAPHGIGLFDGTSITTVGHAITLLLTNHFGFHLAQLSSCRREAGLPAIF